jgi:hypothetical protein
MDCIILFGFDNPQKSGIDESRQQDIGGFLKDNFLNIFLSRCNSRDCISCRVYSSFRQRLIFIKKEKSFSILSNYYYLVHRMIRTYLLSEFELSRKDSQGLTCGYDGWSGRGSGAVRLEPSGFVP